MKKVFDETEKLKLSGKDNVRYSEHYAVEYLEIDAAGFHVRKSCMYYAAGKNAHEAVKARFRKDMPRATLLKVIYQ